jgi:ATP phosphoribosyltransferase
MRSPTVAPLFAADGEEAGFAVKIAVKKNEIAALLPRLKTLGATDIIEMALRKVMP